MENSMEIPQKTKNRTAIWPSHPISGYRSKWTEIRISKRYLHSHVYNSIIYNSPDMETTQVSGWIGKENIVYTQSGILFCLKKEEKAAICNNMDEPGGHYGKWNKSVTEGQIQHDSTYLMYLKYSNPQKQRIQ